jgi:CO dehydrogenase/acetyl-CoA synthase delta subunit
MELRIRNSEFGIQNVQLGAERARDGAREAAVIVGEMRRPVAEVTLHF